MKLSIVMPGIRTELWRPAWSSMVQAYSGVNREQLFDWELIIVGPSRPTFDAANVVYIEDHGSPVRSLQRGIVAAKGEWIAWASDDGLFEPDYFDKSFEFLHGTALEPTNENSPHVALTGRYTEGEAAAQDGDMLRDEYYYLRGHHTAKGLLLPSEYLAMNGSWLVHGDDLRAIGGLDCRFETVAIAFLDLAVRLQNAGVKVLLQPGCAVRFSHQPGETGDHGPVHRAHFENDEPLFRQIYSDPKQVKRTAIPLFNWAEAPARWERRFGPA